jgi:hypothetical protein
MMTAKEKAMMRALFFLSCLALLLQSAIADTLDERPAVDDYTNAVGVGTWCGRGIEFRSIVLGDHTAFLPHVASQQELVAALKQRIHAKYPSFVKPSITNGAGDQLCADAFSSSDWVWTNDADFLTYCGLVTNYLADTPYFTRQNPLGWTGLTVCLSNMVLIPWAAITWTNGEGYYTVPPPWTNWFDSRLTNAGTSGVVTQKAVCDAPTIPLEWWRGTPLDFEHGWLPPLEVICGNGADYSVQYSHDTEDYTNSRYAAPSWNLAGELQFNLCQRFKSSTAFEGFRNEGFPPYTESNVWYWAAERYDSASFTARETAVVSSPLLSGLWTGIEHRAHIYVRPNPCEPGTCFRRVEITPWTTAAEIVGSPIDVRSAFTQQVEFAGSDDAAERQVCCPITWDREAVASANLVMKRYAFVPTNEWHTNQVTYTTNTYQCGKDTNYVVVVGTTNKLGYSLDGVYSWDDSWGGYYLNVRWPTHILGNTIIEYGSDYVWSYDGYELPVINDPWLPFEDPDLEGAAWVNWLYPTQQVIVTNITLTAAVHLAEVTVEETNAVEILGWRGAVANCQVCGEQGTGTWSAAGIPGLSPPTVGSYIVVETNFGVVADSGETLPAVDETTTNTTLLSYPCSNNENTLYVTRVAPAFPGSNSFWTGQIPQSTNLYLCGQDHWDGYVVGENLPYGGWYTNFVLAEPCSDAKWNEVIYTRTNRQWSYNLIDAHKTVDIRAVIEWKFP